MRIPLVVSYCAWIFLGICFVFSGLSKGLDLFAVTAKIQDYSNALHIHVPKHIFNISAISLIWTELIIGMLMLKGICRHIVYRCTMILLVLFTALTLFVAIIGRMEDCGCFGHILSTSPWQSFIKNCVLLILSIISYPQVNNETHFNIRDMLMCFLPPILLCVISSFNQPIQDSLKYKVGEKIDINNRSTSSLDIDFISDTVIKVRSFAIINDMKDESIPLILNLLPKSGSKPLVITSLAPRNVNSTLVENSIIGLVDNTSIENIIHTDIGVVILDNDSRIIHKWQKDYLGFQSCNFDWKGSIAGREFYILSWLLNVIIAMYLTFTSIKRVCRKTHQRVGN